MQVFEFHFNPPSRTKQSPDLIFDSFCFEPGNIYEKRAGSLYMIGVLKSALPQNTRFLNNLTRVIKEKFFKVTLKGPEKALGEALKTANEFLEGIARKGDVSWMGNLNFAALSLKNLELNFSKVGDIKIILLRNGQIIDIDKRLKFQDLEPYPIKVFPNIVSGKMAEGDIILVFTKELFDSFRTQNLIGEIARIFPFDEKKMKEIFRRENEKVSRMQGVLLLLNLSRNSSTGSRQILPTDAKKRDFSLKIIFSPIINLFKKIAKKYLSRKRGRAKNRHSLRAMPQLRLPKLPDSKRNASFSPFAISQSSSRNVILILSLAFFLTAGFFISKNEGNKKLKSYLTALTQIQEKTDRAESILGLGKITSALKKNSTDLLFKSWEDISPLIKTSSDLPKSFRDQTLFLRDRISKNLFDLSKLVKVDEPELLAEIKKEEIIPQKIILNGTNLYLFSSYSQNLLKISGDGSRQIIPAENKFNFAVNLDNSIAFFAKPDKFFVLGTNEKLSVAAIPIPSSDFNASQVSSFKSNIYFYDKKTGDIQKAQYLSNLNWGQPTTWLPSIAKKPVNAKSITASGSIWVLTQDNKIERYYAGYFQETLNIELFPYPEDFTKILASPPYLYLLEPALSRIIILDKSGGIVKQFQSKKFDNLLDFSISDDGEIIYLLNGQKVYRIQN
ncbi:MAG: hypothetical protein Q7K28_00760 [Candidatus Wildermuthbacteria bacterium]|nr:hypothetical protein [Candidatus Wildermuthbacteria bacterium]